ncbi:MAG: hypothetical protein IJN52_04915 [Bacteroidales bacterium]|nr:hypothetical protein [Bacteroidales bacterium]
MDIDLLSKMVKELILDNDRVVLPGLGSFVAEIVPSTFSDKGYTINPPYRRLYFRSKPDEGEILIRFYAESNNVEMHLADRIIRDFVTELKSLLFSRKNVVFPGLGRLRATKENNIFFVADEDLDIYPAGFGLEPVSLKTHQETREEVKAAVEGLKSVLAHPMPEPEAEPEAMPEAEPVADEKPSAVAEPEHGTCQEIRPEPAIESEPEVVTEPTAEPEADPETTVVEKDTESAGRNVRKILITIVCVIAAVVLLLLVALAIVGRVNPDFVDRFLYTPEELKILNHIL